MAGFEWWEQRVNDYDHNNPHNISQTSGTTTVDVLWVGGLTSDTWGIGSCLLKEINFNKNKRQDLNNDPALFRHLAAHELGHVIGYEHVHERDSRDSHNPTMWACSVGNATDIRQDDETAVQYRSDISGVWRSATANSSFEEDTYNIHWALSSGSTIRRLSPGVDGTPYYAAFRNYSAEPYMFITSSIADDPSVDWVKGRANYRRINSSDTGTVKVMQRVREYTESGASCGLPARRSDSGTRSYTTSLYYSVICTVPSTSFNYCTTSGKNPAGINTGNGGIDVRIYVYNRMYTAYGVRAEVGIDRVRILADT